MRLKSRLCLLLPCLVLAVSGARAADDDETALLLSKRAHQSLVEGEHEDALRRYRTIAKLYPRTDRAADAWWQIARLENHLDDKQAAFDALQVLITRHAGHFEKAHAEQLGLARSMMDAEEQRQRRRGLELARSKALNEAEQEMLAGMLQTIIRNGPQSEVARQAHYDFALMLERAGKLPQALLMHEEFVEAHTDHELADDAACQIAYIRYKQWKTMKSAAPRQAAAARDALVWFLARYPQSERAALARSCLAELRLSEQKELESLARYYEGQGKPDAAAVYWRELALKFPELAVADKVLREKIAGAVDPVPQAGAVGPARAEKEP
ncbi:MAG: outer membrane protein assembly factor BamD [Prosthecobacter sp.]|nr:outer membrane protein assembly factor BamD [Prosthecobacter sp.]